MSALKDDAARRRIREDYDTTLVVEAAAGTGKTTELVLRIAGLLRTGRAVLDHIVAVTFTDKAAGEMKLRLRAQLEKERQSDASDAERDRLGAAMEALETAHIGTMHAFCLDLLRERPVQALVDPSFEVLAENLPLIERAFDAWYQRTLDDPPEALTRFLAQRRWSKRGPRDALLNAVEPLVEQRDFAAPWSRPVYEREREIDALMVDVAELGAIAARVTRRSDHLGNALRELHRLSDGWASREVARHARDHHLVEHDLMRLLHKHDWKRKGSGKELAPGIDRAEIFERHAALRDRIASFVAISEADLAAGLQEALAEVVADYQQMKAKSGALDYIDLLLCVRDMLRRDASVREELSRRFTHLFVDEFQDTDPLQAEILLLLASEDATVERAAAVTPRPGKLFVVGDPKQAIYRFRRADVALYQEVKRQLVGAGAEVLHLTTSFRSLPAIQGAVNQAFAPLMSGAWQAEYVPLDRFREMRSGQPAVVALPIPDPYSVHGNLQQDAIRKSEPDAVAAFIDFLVNDSGWRVEEQGRSGPHRGEGTAPAGERSGPEWVPVQARHVCLLFKAMHLSYVDDGDVTRAYVRALEARRIPHVLVGGRTFHGCEEIMALRAALPAIEWRDDELAIYATLRGPLFSIGDDELLVHRTAHGRLSPFGAAGDGEVAEALESIAALHRRRNRRPIAATIGALLQQTRAHAGFAIWPTGEQALANVLRAMDEARRFEHAGATSFRAFVEHLDTQARRGKAAEAPVLEEGTDGVRIMTVHGAKGLEFPVVVLCDLSEKRSPKRPSRWLDPSRELWARPLAGCVPLELIEHADEVLEQDAAEGVRVGYVAATRARDLLVVPAVGDARRSGWVDVLHDAIYPAQGGWREAVAGPGCPAFSGDSVRYRPPRCEAQPQHSVMPGLHRAGAGGHGVVWWDPRALRLDAPALGGLRQMDLLEEDVAGDPGDERQRAWAERRRTSIAAASQPTAVAVTITALAQEPDGGHGAVGVLATDVLRDGRPRGARFGSLVHALLASVPFSAEADAIARLAAAHALMLGASDDERRHAADAVAAALRHPLMVRAATSPQCRREAPVVMRREDGRFAEGVVDLAFREDDGWHVIDFKTDAGDEGFAVYAAQVSLYARAIEAATRQPAAAYLLRV